MTSTAKQTEHTPTPWTLFEGHPMREVSERDHKIYEGDDLILTIPCNGREGGPQLHRARLIVRAVNAHEDLVEALTKLCLYLKELEQAGYGKCENNPLFKRAIDALTKAGVQS